jgi:hypothetical protein
MPRTKLPRERERKVQASIRVRLWRLHGIRLYRRNVALVRTGDGRKFSVEAPGRSDLYGMFPASHGCRHVEIETKATGEKPTAKQVAWLKEMTRLGAVALWGDNCNDVERCIKAILAGGKVVWHENEDFHIEMP